MPDDFVAFARLCKVEKPDETISPENSVCRVMMYIRLFCDMTQAEIAEISKDYKYFSQSYIAKIEKMEAIPTFETAYNFCKIVNIDYTVFLDCVAKTTNQTNSEAAEYVVKALTRILMEGMGEK